MGINTEILSQEAYFSQYFILLPFLEKVKNIVSACFMESLTNSENHSNKPLYETCWFQVAAQLTNGSEEKTEKKFWSGFRNNL
jgi:hypothetical protein